MFGYGEIANYKRLHLSVCLSRPVMWHWFKHLNASFGLSLADVLHSRSYIINCLMIAEEITRSRRGTTSPNTQTSLTTFLRLRTARWWKLYKEWVWCVIGFDVHLSIYFQHSPSVNELLYHCIDVLTEADLRYLRFQSGEPPILRKSAKYERITAARKKLTENYMRGIIDRMVFLRNMGGLSMKVNDGILFRMTFMITINFV